MVDWNKVMNAGQAKKPTCVRCGELATRIDNGEWDEDPQHVCAEWPDCSNPYHDELDEQHREYQLNEELDNKYDMTEDEVIAEQYKEE